MAGDKVVKVPTVARAPVGPAQAPGNAPAGVTRADATATFGADTAPNGMVTTNPAPDASPPSVAAGSSRVVHISR